MSTMLSALPFHMLWSKQGKGRYELRSGTALFGSVQRRGWCAREFSADSSSGNWIIRRVGLGLRTEIYLAGGEGPIASFKPGWSSGGLLTFADGQTFRLSARGFLRPIWTVSSENGRQILAVDHRGKSVTVRAAENLEPQRLALLALFTWCRILQASEDAAVVAFVSS